MWRDMLPVWRGGRKEACETSVTHTHTYMPWEIKKVKWWLIDLHRTDQALHFDHAHCLLQIIEVWGSSSRSSQPFTLGNMWWPSRRRHKRTHTQHSLYAGILEVAETPWTALPLSRTTVSLKCQPGTDRGDLSNTSARVHSGRWNSPQTPHRIPDPFPRLTHGGSAGEALQANRSIHPAPDAGSCFKRREEEVFGKRWTVSPSSTVLPVETRLPARIRIVHSYCLLWLIVALPPCACWGRQSAGREEGTGASLTFSKLNCIIVLYDITLFRWTRTMTTSYDLSIHLFV